MLFRIWHFQSCWISTLLSWSKINSGRVASIREYSQNIWGINYMDTHLSYFSSIYISIIINLPRNPMILTSIIRTPRKRATKYLRNPPFLSIVQIPVQNLAYWSDDWRSNVCFSSLMTRKGSSFLTLITANESNFHQVTISNKLNNDCVFFLTWFVTMALKVWMRHRRATKQQNYFNFAIWCGWFLTD